MNIITELRKLTSEELDKFDLSHLEKLGFRMQNNLLYPPGDSPFKLYAYLSKLFDGGIILDVGTEYGNSALALSHNENNTVISYNIVEEGASGIDKKNIVWKIMDFRDDESIDYDAVRMICIDVDPHDGSQEIEMFKFLQEKEWEGILIFDDIHVNGKMDDFWNSIEPIDLTEDVKYDITHIGHSSGTGIILM